MPEAQSCAQALCRGSLSNVSAKLSLRKLMDPPVKIGSSGRQPEADVWKENRVGFGNKQPSSPNLEHESLEVVDQLEVSPVRGNQPCAMCACSQRDQDVKVQVAQFLRLQATLSSDVTEKLPRFEPVVLGR